MSSCRRGPGYLSDLDADLLPTSADLEELLDVGEWCLGLDQSAIRSIFRKLRWHQQAKLRLPREALRIMNALGFFAKRSP
jgi:hypothetical protein